jgi:phosphatidylglycerol:prolipoprotein diacylglycerol transferase
VTVAFFPTRTIFVEVGSISVYWYGLLYVLAAGLGIWLAHRVQTHRQVAATYGQWTEIAGWVLAGVVVGGRLGYVLLYEPSYFLAHPGEILRLSGGGMSAHGGILGAGLALWYVARAYTIPFFQLTDVIAVPAATGLALGRLGNFINQELYGTVTTLPWGISISGIEGIRHPVSLYAVGKNLLLALLCWWQLRSSVRPGSTTAVFLIGYGVLRFTTEFFREPTHAALIAGLTRGQVFTIPLLLVGLWLGYRTVWFRQ